jgi:hypothetical protein
MALVTPSPRSSSAAARQSERANAATAAPLTERPDPLAACVGEGARREYIRMELLLARAAQRSSG